MLQASIDGVPLAKKATGLGLLLGRAYLFWAVLTFILSFLVLLPGFLLSTLHPALKKSLFVFMNQIWCWFWFPVTLQVLTCDRQFRYQGKPVVYVSNHASYLDIPCLQWTLRGAIAFLGKASLMNVPLFGWYFRTFHIAVDRRNRNSRVEAILQSELMVKRGHSPVFFPEGTINMVQPSVKEFKDGAFRVAISQQVDVVPITIAKNWRICPSDGTFIARWLPNKVTIHPAISTQGMTEADVFTLRERVRAIIADQLAKDNQGIRPTLMTA